MTSEQNNSFNISITSSSLNYVPDIDKYLPFKSFPIDTVPGEYKNKILKSKKKKVPYLRIYQEKKLQHAINSNNKELVTILLQDGVNPNVQDAQKRSGLHLASSFGYVEIVETLLAWGADPNMTDILGNTPLHLAACSNNINMIYILLRGGTNIRSINNNGRNPLDIAKSKLRLLSHRFFKKDLQVSHDVSTFIADISKITKLMIYYLNMTNHKDKDNIHDLESISEKLGNINIATNDASNELGNLLNDLETLAL